MSILISHRTKAGLLLAASLTWPWAQAQVMPHQSGFKSVGTVNCASSTCHGSIDERTATPVMQNEYTTWLRQDPHTQAYSVLKNEQSKTIARNLGLPQPAHESKVCLDCHSHNAPNKLRGERFDITDGVNCEGCHGPAEKWIKTHLEPNATRSRNVADGMYPTHDAYALGKLCTSCHIGDSSRPITHQIMGAGHPRMSIEVDTFLALQPPHYRIDDDWRKRKGSFSSAKIWAMGQFAAGANLLDLISNPQRNTQGIMPEFMMFDCHACHSPMSRKDWEKPMASAPGQPRLNDSSLLMVQAIVRGVLPDEANALEQRVKALHIAATASGSRLSHLEKAAVDLREHMNGLRQKVAATTLSDASLDRTLTELIQMANNRQYPDFAGAEQVYMGLGAVLNAAGTRTALTQRINSRMPALLKLLSNDEAYDRNAFQQQLSALKRDLGSPQP